MNGGGSTSTGGCYPHYTSYHSKKAQKFGTGRGQLLSSDVSGVSSDGLYMYNPNTRSLEPSTPEARFMAPVETGVPVVTFVSHVQASILTSVALVFFSPVHDLDWNTRKF